VVLFGLSRHFAFGYRQRWLTYVDVTFFSGSNRFAK